MRFRIRPTPCLACSVLLIAAAALPPALADPWRGTLEDGAQVIVDPESRRAWRLQDERRAPLWDGVHRLEDGSVVIVRDGTAVPSKGMLDVWDGAQVEGDLPESSACYALVDKVCGKDFRCSEAESCRLAQELVDLAKDERRQVSGDGQPSIEAQCREALAQPFFAPCD